MGNIFNVNIYKTKTNTIASLKILLPEIEIHFFNFFFCLLNVIGKL